MIRAVHPGSRIRIRMLTTNHPGSRIRGEKGTESRIRIRNTGKKAIEKKISLKLRKIDANFIALTVARLLVIDSAPSVIASFAACHC